MREMWGNGSQLAAEGTLRSDKALEGRLDLAGDGDGLGTSEGMGTGKRSDKELRC